MDEPVIAYCVKCKQKCEMKDPKEVTLQNGRRALKGTCKACSTGMMKFIKKA